MTLRRGKHAPLDAARAEEAERQRVEQAAQQVVQGAALGGPLLSAWAEPAAVRTGGLSQDYGALALRIWDKFFPGASWRPYWRSWQCGIYGQPMTDAEALAFREITGRAMVPPTPPREAHLIKGRRCGGTRQAAFNLGISAGVRTWAGLAPGEKPLFPIITPSRRQGAVAFSYVTSLLEMLPGVSIVRRTLDELELSNGAIVRVETPSFRTARGFACPCAFIDEAAFLRDDSGANPFRELLRALRPSVAGVPGSLLLVTSSPYSARDVLYETFERHYGRDDSDILIGRAATRLLNPTIPQALIDRAFEEDPSSAAAEWNAEFRSDLETLLTREALSAITVRERYELAPQPGCAYVAFLDPAGGSGRDSMTLGIAHRDARGRPVLDCVREVKPPFSPEEICRQFAVELKRYGVLAVYSDAYAAEWPREQFAKLAITVQPSSLTRSALYLELVPMVNSGGLELLDLPRLVNQLADLERRTGTSGKDAVDHRRGQHDDLANAAAGALVMATQAVGLKAPLPATFTACNREISGLPALGGGGCYLLGGVGRPPGDGICRNCTGHTFVTAARTAHQARTGEYIDLVEFFRASIGHNTHTERRAWTALIADSADAWGV